MFSLACLHIQVWIMSFLQKYLEWRDIIKDKRLYMRRFYLFRSSRVSIFLHYLARGDEDQHLHSHPWSFIAILLSGTYLEEDAQGFHRKYPFIPRFRKAEYQHRLHLAKPIWTLFIHFKRRRRWGFQVGDQEVYWREYLTILPSQNEQDK